MKTRQRDTFPAPSFLRKQESSFSGFPDGFMDAGMTGKNRGQGDASQMRLPWFGVYDGFSRFFLV
jgi:hypothetical protein